MALNVSKIVTFLPSPALVISNQKVFYNHFCVQMMSYILYIEADKEKSVKLGQTWLNSRLA